jgi:hypothetical protein
MFVEDFMQLLRHGWCGQFPNARAKPLEMLRRQTHHTF